LTLARDRIDLVVADDHPVVIAGIDAMLADNPAYCIVARCADAESALGAIRETGPDVALVKLELTGTFDMMSHIRREGLSCAVILFGARIEERQALEAIRSGARGLLLKSLSADLIEECIRKVARGERWIEKDSTAQMLERLAQGGPAPGEDGENLTGREQQLVRLAAGGLRNREIAKRLGISEGTVKIHLHRVYRKLGIRGRMQLVAIAQSRGLI